MYKYLTVLILLILAAAALSGCGGGARLYPNREPLWRDPDRRPFAGKPEKYYSPFAWDGADQTIFRPVSRFFAVDPGGEAANVNALDEVPDSSWFTNRIGLFPMSPEAVRRGYCTEPPLQPEGKWTVTDAKPDGANPGFIIKTADGSRYLLKFDGTLQGERATVADVFGSRIYHAAGYHAPCNTVVFFDRSILQIAEDATREDEHGDEIPLTRKDIETVLSKSYRLADGRYRASASRFLPGIPIGPWTYQGTRGDDPNDVIAHEDRRELRGGYVLASWLNHFDTREQNTLSVWVQTDEKEVSVQGVSERSAVEARSGPSAPAGPARIVLPVPDEPARGRKPALSDGSAAVATASNDPPERLQKKDRGYVRHYYIDFGDCLGSLWEQEGISRRLGHANYLDFPYLFEDTITLGLLHRPWHSPRFGTTGPVLGYYGVRRFVPDMWKPGYPNPAFSRATERDNAWMARVIAQMTEEHVRAALEPARVQDPLTKKEIIRILRGRRARLLRRWFKNLSPLALPEIVSPENKQDAGTVLLCLRDLAVFAGVVPAKTRVYRARAWSGASLSSTPIDMPKTFKDDKICVSVPKPAGDTSDKPEYLIVDIIARTQGYDAGNPARVHLYHLGADSYRIVALQRPDDDDPP